MSHYSYSTDGFTPPHLAVAWVTYDVFVRA